MDGLKAINVYVIATDDGLVLVDGGWAIPEARELLDRCLRSIGSGFGDIRRFLVTHIHRDHFTMATVLGHELGADVALGIDEKPGLDLFHHEFADAHREPVRPACCVTAGRRRAGRALEPGRGDEERPDLSLWQYPDTWLEGDHPIPVGARTLDAVHTPGPHAGPLRLRRPGRRAAVRRRPRAAHDHAVDRLHGAADAAAAGRLHGLADQGAGAARPDGSCPRTGRSRRPRTPGSTSCWPTTSTGSTSAWPRSPRPAERHEVAGQLGWTRHEHGVRRPRRVQRRAWPRWRPRPTSSCSSPAASATRSEDADGVVTFAAAG